MPRPGRVDDRRKQSPGRRTGAKVSSSHGDSKWLRYLARASKNYRLARGRTSATSMAEPTERALR